MTDPLVTKGRLLWAPLMICLLFCGGCLLLPIPTPEHQNDDLPGRSNVTAEVIESLKPGLTTRLEILQRLGAPDGVFDNERTFVYLWSKTAGYFVWAFFSNVQAGSGAETIGKGYALIVELDEAGKFRRHEILSKNNWTHWEGPRVDRTVFPEAIRNPTRLSAPTATTKPETPALRE
jgi:hypothetical protein